MEDAVKKEAKPFVCGEDCEKGFFLQTNHCPCNQLDMDVCNVEVFGPIAPIITVKDEEGAVKVANSTELRLGAQVWTRDLERAEKLAKRIKARFASVNGMVRSDPRLLFGGIKKSGVGRELSHYGIKQFTNIKAMVVNK